MQLFQRLPKIEDICILCLQVEQVRLVHARLAVAARIGDHEWPEAVLQCVGGTRTDAAAGGQSRVNLR